MAVGLPLKTTYANGDVYSASDVNDTNGTINTTAAPYAAGKNKIINGDFGVNQRAFTTSTADATFGFDRFRNDASSGATFTAQVFTPGTAPVAGYESTNYLRCVTTGQTGTAVYTLIKHTIEDVRTFAGQTVTLSFWAKANTGTPKIAADLRQNFGTGGSPSATVNTYGGQATLSTSWARYSLTVAIPSISGKTLGTTANTSHFILQLWLSAGTDFNSRTGSLGIQSNTFEIWGIQLEAGSTATAFQTATGTIQGELAACQRYYWRQTGGYAYSGYGTGAAQSTTNAQIIIPLPVNMRVNPASIDYSTLALFDLSTVRAVTAASILTSSSSQNTAYCDFTVASGLTQYRPQYAINNNNSAGYIGFSAEL